MPEQNPFIKIYNANASGFNVSSAFVGNKFILTSVCLKCERAKLAGAVMNAADENLARAIAFLNYELFCHTQDKHK